MKNKVTLIFSNFAKVIAGGVLFFTLGIQPVHALEKITYYHNDGLGSPVAGTDEAGALLWKEDYKPYGERIRKEVDSESNTRWFTGHPEDKETGFIYAGARHYDPVVGRFMAVDPVGFNGSIHMFNRYAYANNNPYKYVDPDGEAAALAWFATPPGIAALEKTGVILTGLLTPIAVNEAIVKPMMNENSSDSGTGTEGDLLKDTKSKSKSKKNEKSKERDFIGGGGFDQANDSFDNTLRPKNVKDQGGGVRSGELDNGTRVTVRPKNSPSIDIRPPGAKKPIKVRF